MRLGGRPIAQAGARSEGAAVHYDFEWPVTGEAEPVTQGNFIVRYWP